MKNDTIRLGLLSPLTGLVSLYGEEISRAAQIAVSEVNESGGLLGKKLELIIYDDGSLPETAVPAAKNLIEKEKCVSIIGNLLSNSRIAVANQVAKPKKIPLLNFSFYEGSISNKYFFHFAALPNQQIDKMIPYMAEKFGLKFFFAGSNYEWPKGSIDAAKKSLIKIGGEVVGEEYLPIGSDKIDILLDDLLKSGADVFVPYFAGIDQVNLLTKFVEKGLKEKMAVVMGHYDEAMVGSLSAKIRSGLYSSNTYFMNVQTKENKKLMSRLKKYEGVSGIWPKGNGVLTNFGEGTYICVKAFAEAVKKANSTKAEHLIKELEEVEVLGPQGKVMMDAKTHHAFVNSYLSRCEDNGSFTIIENFGLIEPVIPDRYRSIKTNSEIVKDNTHKINNKIYHIDINKKPENIIPALFILDGNFKIINMNESAKNIIFYDDSFNINRNKITDFFSVDEVILEKLPVDKNPRKFICESFYTKNKYQCSLENIVDINNKREYFFIVESSSIEENKAGVTAQKILSLTDIAIIGINEMGRIAYVNDFTCDLFGYFEEELLGHSLNMLIPPRYRERHTMQIKEFFYSKEKQKRMSVRGEIAGYKKDGSEFPAIAGISKIKTESGTLMIASIKDLTEQKKIEEKLTWKATHDPLTGLPNRALIQDRISNALERSKRSQKEIAVLFVDLDNFKLINDSYGHDSGDELLIKTAELLLKTVRPGDTVSRFGGDEYVILCENINNKQEAFDIAARIVKNLHEPILINDIEHYISGSVGIAFGLGGKIFANELIRNADVAMYEAKTKGRDIWRIFSSDLEEASKQELFITNNLKTALINNEFQARFQPIFNINGDKVIGVELLARWIKDGEFISPAVFIPIAEKSDSILEIGNWAFEEGCKVQRKLQEIKNTDDIYVSVNLSTRQLNNLKLISLFKTIIEQTKAWPENMNLEITETSLMSDSIKNIEILRKFSNMKIGLSVDDFGTGYSSLNNLSNMPVNNLKIDKSFIDNITTNKENQMIVSAVISMAKAMNLKVTAEGVETSEQLEVLKSLKCDYIQGYLFSRPLNEEDFLTLIKSISTNLSSAVL
ncbi:MAG: ABC transporter substrate-binding protein [Spirochaetia bacterium]|nr:ABC transporter substrate-binding protein [Spirochaetia bacterium]